MTPERTAELLPVLQAYAAGKPVQWATDPNGPWLTTDPENTDFDEDPSLFWRIKLEDKTYRVALMQVPGKVEWYPVIAAHPPGVYTYSQESVAAQTNFVRWLTDTVPYEE